MNEPDPFQRKSQRRASEIAALKCAIDSAMQSARAACAADPELVTETAPLLQRLQEIREELHRFERAPATPLSGQPYLFWTRFPRRELP